MSVQAMQWARGKAPTAATQLVLFALADRADSCGVTYVGQVTLAASCSTCDRTVRRHLARLERDRLIARVRRADRRGHRSSDFTILAPGAANREPMADVEADEIENGRYPAPVGELACEGGVEELANAEPLDAAPPATSAGRSGSLPVNSGHPYRPTLSGRPESLPDKSGHPYRTLTTSLPDKSGHPYRTHVSGEQLVEQLVEQSVERTDAEAPDAGLPDTLAGRDEADAAAWERFQLWWAQHPRIPGVTQAWNRFVAEERNDGNDGAALVAAEDQKQ